jgi:MFS family permease
MGMVNQLFLSLIGALLVGLGMVGFMATAQTVIQMGAPPELRGRILGTWTATLSGALPLGNFVAGPLADAWGVDWVLRAMGLGIFVAWAVWTAISVRKRNTWTNSVQSANNNG